MSCRARKVTRPGEQFRETMGSFDRLKFTSSALLIRALKVLSAL